MTTSKMKRCSHCNSSYYYYPSTYGFIAENNDDKYCPDCYSVTQRALSSIPIKFEKRFIKTTDYTQEQIIEVQETRCNNGVPIRRVKMPLYDMKDSKNEQHNVCERMKDPVSGSMLYYAATWWSKKPYEVEITKEVWWDIEKDCVASNQTN